MLLCRTLVFIAILSVCVLSSFAKECEDFSADSNDCTKFFRCFKNIRIRFTCPPDSAWEESLKTCVGKNLVEACRQVKVSRRLDEGLDNNTFDADPDVLQDIEIGKTLDEGLSLGQIVVPKSYRCSFCSSGSCAIVINTIECFCGNTQCSSTAAPTTVQPRNPCADNPCLNGGQCVSNGPGFLCTCPPSFTGNRCEAPAATPCSPNPCLNGGICIPQGNSFTCQCPFTYTGRCCETLATTTTTTTTTPYNPCAFSPCQNGGICIPLGNNFMCQCPGMYTGRCCETLFRTTTTTTTTTTPYNPCAYSPCQNGGICIPIGNNFMCQCPTSYTGRCCETLATTTTTTTTTPYNPCAFSPCQNGGICIPLGNNFMCQCPAMYTGRCCETLFRTTTTTTTTTTPYNPCAYSPCQNGGICIPFGNNFMCQCPTMYTGRCCEILFTTTTTTTTTPYNPCAFSPCQNGGICIPFGNNFMCQCPSTYTGRCCETLATTTTPFDPCANAVCQNGGRCIPTGNSYLCQCASGFYGTRCESRNYCMPNPCSNNGYCTQTTTGYICACLQPYTGPNCNEIVTTTTTTTVATRAPCGGACACIFMPCPTAAVVVSNPCVPNPCQNMGGCAVQNNAPRCWCPDSHQGYFCQYGRSARSLGSNTCNKTCLNGGRCYFDERHGEERCSCSNEYFGSQCEFANGPKSCSPRNPCMNGAECVENKNGAQCICSKGTSGVLCEKIHRSSEQDRCPLDCQGNGFCVYVDSTPTCRCPKNRTGRLCELRAD